jgi:hypothetical protein
MAVVVADSMAAVVATAADTGNAFRPLILLQ